MKRSPKHIDLFAGCGGLSLGLEQAGFQPVFVNELSPDARGSYLLNRQNHFAYLSDPAFRRFRKIQFDHLGGLPADRGLSRLSFHAGR